VRAVPDVRPGAISVTPACSSLVNEILGALRLEKHPDKTVIGRIERGFVSSDTTLPPPA
jgi:hypothetical protein